MAKREKKNVTIFERKYLFYLAVQIYIYRANIQKSRSNLSDFWKDPDFIAYFQPKAISL